jgi:uncharacterized protein YodC (DUF2158 family)
MSPQPAAESAAPFAIGDLVRLNSDRLHMTVKTVAGGRVVVRWHDDDGDLIEDDFDPRELTLVRKREA